MIRNAEVNSDANLRIDESGMRSLTTMWWRTASINTTSNAPRDRSRKEEHSPLSHPVLGVGRARFTTKGRMSSDAFRALRHRRPTTMGSESIATTLAPVATANYVKYPVLQPTSRTRDGRHSANAASTNDCLSGK